MPLIFFPAEIGDYEPDTHNVAFVSEFRFVQNQNEEFEFDVLESYKKMMWVFLHFLIYVP